MPRFSHSARFRDLRDDGGWVLVPAMVMMAVTLVLALVLLAVVDRQSQSARERRTTDAAQALADGVVTSTGTALASMNTTDAASLAAAWPTTGPCSVVTGDLGASTATAPPPGETAAQALSRRIQAAVKRGFDETDNDYVRTAAASTKWSVQLCPDRGGDVWSDDFMDSAVTTPASAPRRAVWVRAQADVRGVAGKVTGGSRAAATKVRQANAPFVAPEDLAIGTASFTTNLSTDVTNLLKDGPVGALVVRGLLGQGHLIENGQAKIGLRCGLLDALDNPGLNLCVGGALGGTNSVVGAATNTLGLGALGTTLGGILGIDRTLNLGSYTIAPDRARAAFEALARQNGNYVDTVAGGAAGTPAASTSCFANASTNGKFLTAQNTADQVVYIRQVGDGGVSGTAGDDPFCTLPPGISPAVLVVERGGARVTGAFTGVLYAANRQEIDGATTPAQVEAKRASARYRETVRIEYPGKVTGAVWTDGAGGQVGLYPQAALSTQSLLTVGGNDGICSVPAVGPLLNGIDSLLTTVTGLVENALTTVFDVVRYERTQTQHRYPDGIAKPTRCQLLKRTLGNLTTSQLIDLFRTGGRVDVEVGEERHRTQQRKATIGCALGGALSDLVGLPDTCWTPTDPEAGWSAWALEKTQTSTVAGFVNTLTAPDVVNQLLAAISATLTNWTAVDRNIDRIRLANVGMAVGAEPVPGTYRVVPARGTLVAGGS